MTASSSRRYRFGQIELIPAEGRLLNSGATVPISGRAFDLLATLVIAGGELVTKSDLLDRVWPGLVVAENTLQAQVSTLRRHLGAHAITTVSGRGYRFALPIEPDEAAVIPTTNGGSLPRPTTSFIGRMKEVHDVKRLLERNRMLTIVGGGGCGKTRLAVELANERERTLSGGVHFVELASITRGSLISRQVAATLGVKERPTADLVDDLVEHLADKRVLLILDNAEHLLEPCARLVETLLTRCKKLSLLVTSRESLGVLGEQTYRVPSLAVPPASDDALPEKLAACESVALFVERARVLRPHFAVDFSNAPVLASICRRLDGIPLAIELAAPRVRSMTLDEILMRLDRSFRLLTDGSTTRLSRQRTLRSLIDWSYDLLTSKEQAVFCGVAVFAGGWTVHAAEAVCVGHGVVAFDILDILESLVDKNLISMEERQGVPRYRILDTIRQYGIDRLSEDLIKFRLCKNLHMDYFAEITVTTEPYLYGPDPAEGLDQLEADHDNIRSALAWSLAEQPATGLLLASSAFWFWYLRGHAREGSDWLSWLTDAAPETTPPSLLGKALHGAGVMAYAQSDLPKAKELYEKALQLRRDCGDLEGTSRTLNNLANVAVQLNRLDEAAELYSQVLEAAEQLGGARLVAIALHNLGETLAYQGQYQRALDLLNRSRSLNAAAGDQLGLAQNLAAIGDVDSKLGNVAQGRRNVLHALDVYVSLGERRRASLAIYNLGCMAATMGLIERAARMWGGHEAVRAQLGSPLTDRQRALHSDEESRARAVLGDNAAFDESLRQGRAQGWEEVVRYAIEPGDGWPDDWQRATVRPATNQEISGVHQD